MLLLCTYELYNYISYQVENCENDNKTLKIIAKTVKIILVSQQTLKIITVKITAKTLKIILFSQRTVKIIAKTVKITLFSQQTVKSYDKKLKITRFT